MEKELYTQIIEDELLKTALMLKENTQKSTKTLLAYLNDHEEAWNNQNIHSVTQNLQNLDAVEQRLHDLINALAALKKDNISYNETIKNLKLDCIKNSFISKNTLKV